jgi:hypothetical protein
LTATDFDPYRVWLGIPPSEQPPNHYRLLGIGLFESQPEVISHAADRQMAHVRTFQTGEYSVLSQRILNELSAARVCLLDPAKRNEYDQSLRTQLAATEPPAAPATAPTPPPPQVDRETPKAVPEPGSPDIKVAPSLLRTRAAGAPRHRKQADWLGPAIAIILVTILVAVLVVAAYRRPRKPRRPTFNLEAPAADPIGSLLAPAHIFPSMM